MSYEGIVKNGQITLPPDAVLPEGATVTRWMSKCATVISQNGPAIW